MVMATTFGRGVSYTEIVLYNSCTYRATATREDEEVFQPTLLLVQVLGMSNK